MRGVGEGEDSGHARREDRVSRGSSDGTEDKILKLSGGEKGKAVGGVVGEKVGARSGAKGGKFLGVEIVEVISGSRSKSTNGRSGLRGSEI
jgi:hypothetical protein